MDSTVSVGCCVQMTYNIFDAYIQLTSIQNATEDIY